MSRHDPVLDQPRSDRGLRWSMLAAIISIVAGIYMVTSQAQASDSIFNVFLRGIGAYLVARGIWMAVATARRADTLELLERIAYALESDSDEAVAERD
jgi:hypothetical protein